MREKIIFSYTTGVADFVKLNGFDKEGIELRASEEMNRLIKDGLDHPYNLIMHVFEWNGQEFIMSPAGKDDDRVLIVDLCVYLEDSGPPIADGPFAGAKMSIPIPAILEKELRERNKDLKEETKH